MSTAKKVNLANVPFDIRAAVVTIATAYTAEDKANAIVIKSRETINALIKQLCAAKVVIGDARTCDYAKAFVETCIKEGLAKQSASNKLSAFRAAVKIGAPMTDSNKSRATKKAAPKTGAKLPEGKTVSGASIAPSAPAQTIANPPKPTGYKTAGEVIAALATVIEGIRKTAGAKNWAAVSQLYPEFDDFLDAQDVDTND